ncbi:MAG: ECF transporter S component [Lachnospiraceae bacterium]|jgi:ECF transporter S component (folate family)|nr:ECF transporter S component [Lachnospiraceae bacterium]MCR4685606.1 ECF transporter S component [Lachnospiraceae bacterium]
MKRQTIELTTDAMLAAMCTVLGIFARFLDFGFIKLSLESFPVLVAALLFGPVDGVVVALVGTFLSQLLQYGLDPSTPLWIIPYCIIGLICGLYAKKYKYYNTSRQILMIVSGMEILLFALNTVALYFYAELVSVFHTEWIGKSGYAYVISGIFPRIVVAVIKAAGFGFLMPPLLRALHRFRNRNN